MAIFTIGHVGLEVWYDHLFGLFDLSSKYAHMNVYSVFSWELFFWGGDEDWKPYPALFWSVGSFVIVGYSRINWKSTFLTHGEHWTNLKQSCV